VKIPALLNNAVMAVLFAAALINTTGAHAIDANDIRKRVEKTVSSLKAVSCSFEQTQVMQATGRSRVIEGVVRQKNDPYRLRLEYPAQTIVVDGENVWHYIPRNKQVTVQEFMRDERTFPTPHDILMRYLDRGKAVYAGDEIVAGRQCWKLTVDGGDTEEDVAVWIDRKLAFPIKSQHVTASGDTVTYILRDVVLNGSLNDEIFEYTVPDGVELIDLR